MTTMKGISVARGDYRIVWNGGEYADVHARGLGAIETINMKRNGEIPTMSRQALRDAVDQESKSDWDAIAAEMRAYPTAGAR